jgi:CBS domain-containing protein
MLTYTKVWEWMTSPVISVSPETSMNAAYRLMKDKNIRRLPVVKHDELVGIVTLGDIREARPSQATTLSIWEMSELLDKLTVNEIMSREVLTIGPDDTIIDAAQLMLNRKISGLPVVDNAGKLVGMLTESDIFRMVIRMSIDHPLVETFRVK